MISEYLNSVNGIKIKVLFSIETKNWLSKKTESFPSFLQDQ